MIEVGSKCPICGGRPKIHALDFPTGALVLPCSCMLDKNSISVIETWEYAVLHYLRSRASHKRVRESHKSYDGDIFANENRMGPLTYPCPKCGSNRVSQDPVCSWVGRPLMLHFCCLDCAHQWDTKYEPPKKEATTMQVSYNGFTGELVRLEQTGVEECGRSVHRTYSISIADDEKKVTYSFIDVDMRNVTILDGR